MHHMDMPIDYPVGCYAGTISKTHAKAEQHHAELKTVLWTKQND